MGQHALLVLSRWQFALTAAFHMTFPAVTVGTSVLLVYAYAQYLRTDDATYLVMFRFWRRIFTLGFGLGVVAGIVLTFEFGLNWSGYARAVGPILGVIIGMEVVTAFFVEAAFLGILVYGDGRVSRRVMMFATCMVSIGTLLSVTWILAANSWMQTPRGYRMVNGQFRAANWLHIIFNPAFSLRLPHMFLAVVISAAWFIAGISAFYMLRHRHGAVARRGLSLGLGVVALLVPVQMYLGDALAAFMARHQPAKVEALEGNWTSHNTGYNLLVIPDQDGAHNLWQVTLPWLGSAIAKDWSGNRPTPGLDRTPKAQRPEMLPVFYGFRVMFFGALAMFAVAMIGVVQRLRGTLYTARWFHRSVLWMTPIGILAIIGGWVTSEAGRQPWVVYGRLLTSHSVSPLSPGLVLGSFVGFVGTYIALLTLYIWYVVRIVREGPEDVAAALEAATVPSKRPRPVLAPGPAAV